jgi:hypothetical protein
MAMKALRGGIRATIGVLALCISGAAGAQENLDLGKNPAQLFASDCAICHKSPQGLAKSGGILGLDSFLREHYTASKETATAIANYLKSMGSGPAAPARAVKRTAKGDEKAKPDDKKKPGGTPGEAKGGEKKPEATASEPKSSEPKPAEAKPSEILAPEPKPTEAKPSAPAAGETKPAEGAKPEKSD